MEHYYKIEITAVVVEETRQQGQFTVIDKVPWTEKALDKATAQVYGGTKEFLDRCPLREIRGYAPSVSCTKETEQVILMQKVNAVGFDLGSVIKAINQIF